MPLEDIENLSTDTQNLLKEVIKKKKKKERYERLRNRYLIASLLLIFGFFAFLNVTDLNTMMDPFSTLAAILMNPYYLFVIALIALSFLYHNFYQKKLKKEKTKLNAVRSEAIDYLNDSKNMNLQEQAPAIKKLMKDEFDINLYVKNK